MQTIDLVIIFGYLIGITAFGILFSEAGDDRGLFCRRPERAVVGDRDVDRRDRDEHDHVRVGVRAWRLRRAAIFSSCSSYSATCSAVSSSR